MAILSWKQFIRYLRLLFPLMFNYKVFGIFAFRGNFDFDSSNFSFAHLTYLLDRFESCIAFKYRYDGLFFFSMMHRSISKSKASARRLRCKLIRRAPCHTLIIGRAFIDCSMEDVPRLPQIPLGIVSIRYLSMLFFFVERFHLVYKKLGWKIVLFSRRIFCTLSSAIDIMKINHAKWFISGPSHASFPELLTSCYAVMTQQYPMIE